MLKATWDVFKKLWETQNAILHSSDNILVEKKYVDLTQRLLEFRTKSVEMLRTGDRFIIDYPVRDVVKWPHNRKVQTLAHLEKLHKIHLRELTQANERMRDITMYMVQSNQ